MLTLSTYGAITYFSGIVVVCDDSICIACVGNEWCMITILDDHNSFEHDSIAYGEIVVGVGMHEEGGSSGASDNNHPAFLMYVSIQQESLKLAYLR